MAQHTWPADDDVLEGIAECGSRATYARTLGVAETTLSSYLRRNPNLRDRVREALASKQTLEAKPLDQVVSEAERRDIEVANRAELKRILSSEHRMRRYEAVLADCLQSYEPTELAAPLPDPGNRPVHEDILITGDWHIGQKTTLEETGGMYEHGIETARGQVAKIWKAVNRLHNLDLHARDTRKLHHLFIGDLVEGSNMRPSQMKSVTDVVTRQVIQGFDLLAWLVRQELTIYEEVEIDLIGGNHDRTTQKPGNAGLGESSYIDTFSWLVGAFLERVLDEDVKGGRLKIRNWETYFGYKEIAGIKTVFEHGSSFKWSAGGYGGVPWYSVSNLAPKYAAMLGEADLVILGHGHRPAIIPIPNGRGWTVVNGALPATSTYVQAGQKVVSRPQQWRLSAHEKLGITSFEPIYADVPGTLLPGMVWEDPVRYADRASGKSRP
jgi:hypothetical protein